ncbi:MAG: copper-binding protein [Bryobacteraceae bacterium]|jgi:Cu/Ag efflux protein CusF
MRTVLRLTVLATLLAGMVASQTSKKAIHFAGHVESVDAGGKTVTVKHGDIPGFMSAMTMNYALDDESILNKLAPGDDIVATVYAGDGKLYKVRVVSHAPKKKKE